MFIPEIKLLISILIHWDLSPITTKPPKMCDKTTIANSFTIKFVPVDKKYNQKLYHVEYCNGKRKHKFYSYFDPFPGIMFTELKYSLSKF